MGPLSLHDNGGLGLFLCPRRFFNTFINAKSTVSTFNNTIDVKVSIHKCIFWGCSVDTFSEYNLAIFDHKTYPQLSKYQGYIKGIWRDPPQFLRNFQHCSVLS